MVYIKGMLARIRGASTAATTTDFLKLRFRLRFLHCRRCRRPGLLRTNRPVPVTLNRFDTAFRVLALPAFLDIRAAKIFWNDLLAISFFRSNTFPARFRGPTAGAARRKTRIRLFRLRKIPVSMNIMIR